MKKRLLLQVGRSVIYSRGDDYLQALQPRLAKTHPKVIFVHLIHFCQIYGGTPMSLQKTLVILLSDVNSIFKYHSTRIFSWYLTSIQIFEGYDTQGLTT